MFVALVVVALSSTCGVVHAATVASVDAGAAGTLTQPQRGLAANSGLIYYPLPTANDYMSYTYDDSQKGLNGVCSPTNKCGPSTWKNIQAVSPTVNACAGQSQTPVNIQALDVVNDPTLTYPTFSITSGGCSSWVEFTTLERFGFSFSETGNTCTNFQVTYGGKTWTLTGGHTHSPSEHTFGGGYHDAELHLVHTSSDGKLLVLAINFVADTGGVPNGAAQATLNVMWNAASSAYVKAGGPNTPALPGAVTYDWTVAQTSPYDFYRNLLPPSRAYYTYTGSYTTYPCTEGITWIVFEQPVRISKNDLAIMRAALAGNPNTIADPATGNDNRPVQPLNGRIIKRYTGVDPPTSSPTYKPVAIDPSTSAVAVASFLSTTSGAALTAALSSQFPGIIVSNAVPTLTVAGVSLTQNIPAGITPAQAAADPFKSAYIAALAQGAGVPVTAVTGYTATAGRRLLAGTNINANIAAAGSPTSLPVNAPTAGTAACFAASEQVTLENGATKAIADVVVGDRVLTVNAKTGEQVYSDVAYVPHGKNMEQAVFTVLTTEAGRDVKMTANHVLPAGACDLATASLPYVSASSVVAGDCVETVAGRERVVSVSTVEGRGIYTVIAMEELLVVNGVVATPYGGVNPALANVYYNLHRLAYQVYGAGAMKQWVQAATEMLWGTMSF